MKTKEEIALGHHNICICEGSRRHSECPIHFGGVEEAMQEFSDQQNAKLREVFLELLKLYALMHEGKEYHKVEALWLEKAGLKEKE